MTRATVLAVALAVSVASAVGQTKNPSEEECLAFSARIVKLVKAADTETLDSLTDWEQFLDGIQEGIPKSNAARQTYRNGFLKQAKGRGDGGLLSTFVEFFQAGTDVELVNVRQTGGHPQLLYRYIMPDDQIGYLGVDLAFNPNGQVNVVDSYVMSVGMKFSDVMRYYPLAMAVKEDPEFIEQLSEFDQIKMKHDRELKAMLSCFPAGRNKEALQRFKELPEALQSDQLVLTHLYGAAKALGDEPEMQKAADALLKEMLGQGAGLAAWNHYRQTGEYEKVLQAIDTLDEEVGGDPYLDYYRGDFHWQLGNLDKAVEFYDAAAIARPDLIGPDLGRLVVSLDKKDHVTTLRWLKYLADNTDVEWGDLAEDEDYAEFIKSPQYKEWLEYLK